MQAKGEANTSAKLTKEKVLRARRLARNGMSAAAIARQIGESSYAVCRAITGKTWSHLPGAVRLGNRSGEAHAGSKLTKDDVVTGRALYRSGHSINSIAKRLNVARRTLEDAVAGRHWSHIHGAISPGQKTRIRRDNAKCGFLRGERNHQSKLLDEDVANIKGLLLLGVSGLRLAREYKVCPPLISLIKANKRWRHVLPAVDPPLISRFPSRKNRDEVKIKVRPANQSNHSRSLLSTARGLTDV